MTDTPTLDLAEIKRLAKDVARAALSAGAGHRCYGLRRASERDPEQ